MTLPKYAYFEGKIIPYSQAKVGIMNHTLNYGTGAFGGVRGYWNTEDEQLYIFRSADHFKRLLNSVKLLYTKVEEDLEQLQEVTLELVRTEGLREDSYIRPLVYNADEIIGVRLNDLDTKIAIFTLPFTRYVENDEAAHVKVSSWRRIDDNSIPARGKITGAYINSAFIKTDALLSGFDEALVLTNDGHISEGSAENVFMVRDGVLITPPLTENILEGITRRTLIQLAKDDLGLDVVERAIDRTEVYICDEFFLCGTAAAVTAVTYVDYQSIGTGVMGPITSQLKLMYDDVVRGKLEKYKHWNMPVYIEESVVTK